MPTKIAACAEEQLKRKKSSTFPELAVLLLDERGDICAISEEARSLLGVSRENPTLPASLQELIAELTPPFEAHGSRELVLDGHGGQPVRVEVTTQQVSAHGTHRTAVILSASRHTPESELQRLHRLASAGTLTASLAHEIKNALVAGRTFLDTLLEKHQDMELAGIVRHEMDRIDALVTQMLRFGSPARPIHAPVRVHDLLELSLRLIQPHFRAKAITVERSMSAPSDLVEGDAQQLEQAFLNLLLNSVEAMGQNGTISIFTNVISERRESSRSSGAPRKLLEVRIVDDGAGIAPHNLIRLFEPFFTTKKNGSGLGLAITRKIIKEHGGEISVESETPGGAAFRILLPFID